MKYAPRKVYIKENGGYTELSYEDFCRRRETDGAYKDKLFIPVQGCLIETEQTHYIEFYRDKERWRYLKKLDADNSLLSLEAIENADDSGHTQNHPPSPACFPVDVRCPHWRRSRADATSHCRH